jgi:hypothetical protein
MKVYFFAARIIRVKLLKRKETMNGTVFTSSDIGPGSVVKTVVHDISDSSAIGVLYAHPAYPELGNWGFSFFGLIIAVNNQLPLATTDYKHVGAEHTSKSTSFKRNLRSIIAKHGETPSIYIDLDIFLTTVDLEEAFSYVPVQPGEPEVPAYRDGIIAIDISNTQRLMKNYALCSGKILASRISPRGQHIYQFQHISQGVVQRRHNELIPAEDYFDKAVHDVYISSVDCNCLFSGKERFVLRNGYLHNRNSSVMLGWEKYKEFFTKLESDAPVTTPAGTSKPK